MKATSRKREAQKRETQKAVHGPRSGGEVNVAVMEAQLAATNGRRYRLSKVRSSAPGRECCDSEVGSAQHAPGCPAVPR